MHFRRLEIATLAAAAVVGGALSPGVITGDTGHMLATFLGLVSASILPTISLLVNSMASSGRSVLAINELNDELQAAMDVLFLLFGCIAVVVAALVSLATPAPVYLAGVPIVADQILPRAGQGIVLLFSAATLLRVGHLPAILRRSLSVRHKIAVEEARRKTIEKAPTSDEARAAFPTHPEFGKTVMLEDVARDH